MNSIPPGLYCVPSAIAAITGADVESVIYPTLNRLNGEAWLMGPVMGIRTDIICQAFEKMGWNVRRYRDHSRRSQLRTWAKLTEERWPGRKLIVCTRGHALALQDGLIYDTYRPCGAIGELHPCRRDIVEFAALIEPGPHALGVVK